MIKYTEFDGSEEFDDKEPMEVNWSLVLQWMATIIVVVPLIFVWLIVPWYAALVLTFIASIALYAGWDAYFFFNDWP